MYAPPFASPYGGRYDYTSTPPPPSSGNQFYPPPRYATAFQGAGPSPRGGVNPKSHARRTSQQVPPGYSGYSPRVPPGYSDPRNYSSPLRNAEYVSRGFDFDYDPVTGKTRSQRAPKGMRSGKGKHQQSQADPRHASSSFRQYMHHVFADEQGFFDFDAYYDAPPPYEAHKKYPKWAPADYSHFHQERSHATPTPNEPATAKANQARPRRASTFTSRPQTTPPKSKQPPPKPTRKATEEDARRAGIPAGYSFKNWDPSEEPIVLLGSVFDANSLGKWIYDWTVYTYGPATPMADVAGDLWLLLIQLAGKVKRADETIDKIRQEENRELVEDFLESGERLWVRFKKLLKICEEFMWKAAQRETGDKRPLNMGKNSGCEFVDSIFGRDRELDKTEKLMSNIRLWSMRFDANCDEILRNPAA